MKKYFVFTLLTALLLALVAPSRANELRLAGVFSDHMVLQREVPVPVWGWAKPGEEITVVFAGGKNVTTAGVDGKWLVRLNALAASAEGRELVVRASSEKRKATISDVVVGDVWLCSGQSNMRFQMSRVENAEKEIAAAENPAVRFFMVEEQFAQKPVTNVSGAWMALSPATTAECSAVACYFGRALQSKLSVPIGLLVSSVGGTRIETWMEPTTLARIGVADRLLDKWKNVPSDEFEAIAAEYRAYQLQRDREHPQAVRAAKEKGEPVPSAPKSPMRKCHDCPSALHNGMIAPLQPFAVRGALWYQGESNVSGAAAYEKLQPALIADWRRVWGKELPFLFVQLPPHRGTHPSFREAQQSIWQQTPHTAMIGIMDAGDANDIHPARKRPVGERLGLAARALSYGERVEFSGPVFKSMSIEGDRAVVSFTHIGEGLVAQGGPLKGFTIASTDGKFIAARAEIAGANVMVTSDQVPEPAVRYGWAFVPDVNLFNREGLPAAPFRTDVLESK